MYLCIKYKWRVIVIKACNTVIRVLNNKQSTHKDRDTIQENGMRKRCMSYAAIKYNHSS